MRSAAGFLASLLASIGPAFAQPSWSATGAMNAPHTQHPATLLPNGKVLVVGTLTCNPYCYSGPTAELYDPASGVWLATGQPHIPRFNHIAELLPDGRVLLAGGYVAPSEVTGSSELYDPAAGTSTFTGSLATPRQFHTSAVLPGGKVLVTGGLGVDAGGNFYVLSSAELYDLTSGRWTSAGNMTVPREFNSMTTLSDGRVLVAGGFSSTDSSALPLQSAEIFDPVAGTWTPTASLAVARGSHSAVLLPKGQVLVTGGSGTTDCLSSAELYDPAAGRWNVANSMAGPRRFHTLTLLPSGQVLAAGGGDCTMLLSGSEIYDPPSGNWSPAADLTEARRHHSATLLQNGKVLLAGGDLGTGGIEVGITSSEFFGAGPPGPGKIATVSAASFLDNGAVGPESLATAFGSNLASSTQTAQAPALPTTLAGVSVTVQDIAGAIRQAPLLVVSPGQINYQIPSGTAAGAATVTINNNGTAVAAGGVLIEPVAPGVFSADGSGQGPAAALIERIKADGTQSYEPVAQFDATQQRFVAVPINLEPPTEQVFLLLYGTGIRFRSAPSSVIATLGGATVNASFAGPSQFPGLDQVNLLLPPALAGRGEVRVSLNVDGLTANPVTVTIQ